jgi:DNA-binding CsgD family transcriptional regulator
MSNNTTTILKRLDVVTNVLMIVLLVVPFAMSFGALRDLAAQHGVAYAWLYPIMIDGGLIIFKSLVLRASLRGRSDRYSWFMAATATVVSVALNVVHAPADFLSQFMAALPPVVLLAAFVAVAHRVRESVVVMNFEELAETAVNERDAMREQLETAVNERDAMREQLETAVNERDVARERAAELSERIDQLNEHATAFGAMNPVAQDIARMLAGIDERSQADIARAHNVSKSTVSKYKSSLNGSS